MRLVLFLAILALSPASCTDRNLVGEQIWSDERLARAEVGFGWNYEAEGEEIPSRNIDIAIRPDNSYEIVISGYGLDAEPKRLARTTGKLPPELAMRLRRNLSMLRSKQGHDFFTTLPGCPEWSHPAIEYYVGFTVDEKSAVTILERHCETRETVEGRRIVEEAFTAFPQVDQGNLVAGLADL